jgi:hypothetical protein
MPFASRTRLSKLALVLLVEGEGGRLWGMVAAVTEAALARRQGGRRGQTGEREERQRWPWERWLKICPSSQDGMWNVEGDMDSAGMYIVHVCSFMYRFTIHDPYYSCIRILKC